MNDCLQQCLSGKLFPQWGYAHQQTDVLQMNKHLVKQLELNCEL